MKKSRASPNSVRLSSFSIVVTITTMALWRDIVGVVVGFARLGALSVLRKLIIYNWLASKIGKFLPGSPLIEVKIWGYLLNSMEVANLPLVSIRNPRLQRMF